MEEKIKAAQNGMKISEITELNLDNSKSSTISGLTDEFTSLEFLSIAGVGLTSLKGLPNLPSLLKLELSDNKITGGLDLLKNCPNLRSLNLSGNEIEDTAALEPLKKLKYLKDLQLFDCTVSSTEKFREKLFAMLPSLKSLNRKPSGGGNGGKFDPEDSDEEDLDEDESDEEIDEEDDEIGLSFLSKENIDEESEGDDFDPAVNGSYEDVDEEVDDDDDLDDDDDDDDDDDEEEEELPRGQKRKRDETQEN